jgi:DNA-binding NarL/FixJ family response regulator
MNILCADDHFLVLEGLETLLGTIEFVNFIGKASDGKELLRALNESQYEVLLLDINLGNEDGRDLCKTIKQSFPLLKVIALTSFSDTITVKSAIKAGFDGYLLKADNREEIVNALLAVQAGNAYYSTQTRGAIFENEIVTINTKLTERELEVLEMIVNEKTNKEIASELFISDKTVENHRANIMLKMDVKNVAGLVKKAIQLGLVK